VISEENNNSPQIHKKHADLKRPSVGHFGRNEWAIVGAPCDMIKLFADQVISALSPLYKCAYIDTAHNEDSILLPGRLLNGAALDFTDQINYRQLNYKTAFNAFKLRETFADADLVLANGNHHAARAQVIIIHENKKSSLQKRLAQLTGVEMILLAAGVADVFDFVKEAVPNWAGLPIYRLDDTVNIITFFKAKLQQAKPPICGLVLAGGKSERMGFDKGMLNWHGMAQRYFMAGLLKHFCNDVFISCRADQQKEMDSAYASLQDTFTGLGPYGAILSAFRERPDSAWLVVACDLPLLTEESLNYLVENRNTSTIATAFRNGFNDFPEPLITIWEPKSYPVLLSFLAQGYSCPRKVLINSDTTLLTAPLPEELTNVNTPQDLEKVKNILDRKIIAE
jgi:molybdopterin-guanine dinucleotide biosynthesis protein A